MVDSPSSPEERRVVMLRAGYMARVEGVLYSQVLTSTSTLSRAILK